MFLKVCLRIKNITPHMLHDPTMFRFVVTFTMCFNTDKNASMGDILTFWDGLKYCHVVSQLFWECRHPRPSQDTLPLDFVDEKRVVQNIKRSKSITSLNFTHRCLNAPFLTTIVPWPFQHRSVK